jgi:glutamate/aspartate transport system substrate-binding protein
MNQRHYFASWRPEVMMKRTTVPVLLAVVGFVALLAPALAQEQEEPVRQLTGTLKKIYSSGAVAIGYREASFPLSYVDPHGHPIGYAIDLCAAIVEQIGREIDKPVRTLLVTSETRIPALLADKIDLECGSTTNNVERQKQVAFSPITYVTGTKLMVRRGSGLRSYLDLKGKVVVVTGGTTNEQAMKRLNEKQKLGMNLVSARDHEASYSLMADGKADAFATDDVLLYGFIARHQSQREFIVVGDYLSYDPYGIMFRKDDPQLKDVVLTTFHQLAESRDLLEIYHRWFRRRTPTGERLNLPMNAQLEEAFRVLGLPD